MHAMVGSHPLRSCQLLLIITVIILATSGRGACLCHQEESDALLRLKGSFRFDKEFHQTNLSSWKVDTNCCTWERITCDDGASSAGYVVTALDLSDLDISGNLSSSDIFKLTSLRFLSLAQNDFYASPWPTPGFEHLTSLKYLDLSYSGLSGDLPVENGHLSNLVTLNLSGLDLKYLSLQSLINNLGSLQELTLGDGNIPISPTNLLVHASSTNNTPSSGLKKLSMQYCTITGGHFDTVLPMLANLVTLHLSGLHLKNLSLHALIGSLDNLKNLYLENVNISATSPTNLAHASSTNTPSGLKSLSMQHCTISGGHFDTVLPMLANLVTLDLLDFHLKNSSLHALIGSLRSLKNLYLEHVNMSTTSPTGLAHASSTNTTSGLKELFMVGCTINGGRLDTVLAKLPFLSMLILDDTNFSGPAPMPDRFAPNFLPSLAVLSLERCVLTGTFPSWIFHMRSLMFLDVSWNENLRGELPEFVQGSVLQVLVLSGTKFSGEIPESIGNLHNLTLLDLSNCQFHGPIPPFIQWPMISQIDLSGNNLIGSLPSDGYLDLHNLTTVNLSNNSISGVIPASLFSLPSLESLYLSWNNLTGNFLLCPNTSSNLATIDVSNNKLQGKIPKLLSELVGVGYLDLSLNNFTGTVDLSFIKNYKNLEYLSLSYNKLSLVDEDDNHSYAGYPVLWGLSLASCDLSYVPKFLMQQREINNLDLSNNNIGGRIPDWIWGIGGFGIGRFSLNLAHNLFTSVDANLSNASFLDIDLHSNKLEGALPLPPWLTDKLDYSNNHFSSSIMTEFWSRVSSTVSLSLAHNSLSGELSHLICTATNIGVLDLSFNNLSGLIPPCLLKHKALGILNLRGNNFHGSLPQDISEECALQVIDLNDNKLEGKMPSSMTNCALLQELDLGNNLIVDTFPGWLGILPSLKVLVLQSNRFHGPIDHNGMNKQMHPFFPKLQVLDLSSNSFNGSIPIGFLKQLKAMMVVSSGAVSTYVEVASAASSPYSYPNYMESVTITLKGQETTLVQILSVFMSLDLSNNDLEGVIPNEIGDLKCLKGLNLSRNSFTGGIPLRVTNMLQLESLDLSYNQLSGEIPPSMVLMSFLEVLDLSYNHLSGMIPQSNQFWTFPDTSFLGNDGLCGKPLPRPCDANHAPSSVATTPDASSSKELKWEILSVEAGFLLGLAIVVATTLLWGNGRRWVYWQVDRFLLDALHRPWSHGRRH